MELITAKVFALVTLGLSSMVVGLVPALCASERRNRWPLLQTALLCFGGGVLLATSLVHMLPEVREDQPDLAEVLFCTGFFLLYFVDEMVHALLSNGRHHDHHQRHEASPHQSHQSTMAAPLVDSNNSLNETTPLLNQKASNSSQHCHSSSLVHDDDDIPPSQICHIGHSEPCGNTSVIGKLGLLIALSLHALLEGLAIGLESSASKVLLMVGAVASHKLIVGFCLGIEMVADEKSSFSKLFVAISIFSLGSVLGIGAGTFIGAAPEDWALTASSFLQAIAGGTLLYVTVCEVLPREKARWHRENSRRSAGIIQFSSVLIGFILMTVLNFFLSDCEYIFSEKNQITINLFILQNYC